ncbi:MAG: S-layer homology domain-containing protein [Oscillospiraceae bacterium]
MKKRILGILLVLCMVLSFVPTTVLAEETTYVAVGESYFKAGESKSVKVGSGTATFDPSTSTLTLKDITLSYGEASMAAIESSIPNLAIVLSGTNTINITNDGMAAIYLYGGSNATITGDSNSKLIINSTGKNNKGITTDVGVNLMIAGTNVIINDKTTDAATKGYMVGIKPNGNLTMNGCSYTATGVQSGIEMYTDCVAKLSGVNFNITCTPRQSFDDTVPNEMSIGVNLAPLATGKQNVIENCSGSISAHFPLYVDGVTALKTSSDLTLTTDNYDAVYVNADLTVTGGSLNLTSTGSSGNGFYVLKSSKLVFSGSLYVDVNVGYVAVYLSGDGASAEINSGTLNTTAKAGVLLSKTGNSFTLTNGTLEMTPKTGETQAIGLQSYGTVSIEGGSLKTTAGMYSAIQNAGEKPISISGGTHTLSTSTGTGTCGYIDTANGILNISGTADVTFDGWSDGMDVYGALNLSGGKLTVRNAQDGIYTTGTLNLNGGTLNTSGTRVGVLTGDGGQVNFAGTDATLAGGTAGWGKTSGSGAYSVTGGKVVLQGDSYAASAIYSSLANGYSVYAGSGESNAALISNPTIATFTGNKYVKIEEGAAPVAVTGVTIDETLAVNIGQTKTPSFTVAPADAANKTVSFTSDNTAVATVNATTGAVTGVSKGTATITVKTADGNFIDTCTVTVSCGHANKVGVPAKASTCEVQGWESYSKCEDCGQLFDKDGKEISAIPYLPLAGHTPAQTATNEYLKSAATCTSAAVYYEHCSVCGEKLSTTFTSGTPLSHTESGWKSDADGHWKVCTECGTTTTAKAAHTPGAAATETTPQTCTECGYVIAPALGHTHSLTRVEEKAATCTETGNPPYYVCSGCGKKFANAGAENEITNPNYLVRPALGHNYATVWSSDADGHWHACTRCGDKADEAAHTPDRAAATETDPIKCTVCGYVITPALGHIHTLDKVEAKAPTCTEDGNIEYYVCSGCGKLFADATGKVEITANDVVDKATGHDYKDGVCTRCGAKDPDYKPPVVKENPFVDVSESSVYYDAILWAYYHEPQQITGGYTATEFRPGNPCTRGQVVTFLWRAAGCPEPTGNINVFKDASSIAAPYQKAVAWAVEKGITTGYNDGTFRPNDSVTRAQFVTFLWRYEGKPATTGSIAGFRDASAIADPYQQAVAWAVEKGITTGYNDGSFRPNDTCTRWAVVLFMYRDMK